MRLTRQEADRLRNIIEGWDEEQGEMCPVCRDCRVDYVRFPHKPECIVHELVPDPVYPKEEAA